MDQKHVEVEVKIHVGKVGDGDALAVLEKKLQALGAPLKAPRVYERNVRYEDQDNTLTPAARVLRLRQDTRVRLTYKEPHDSAANGKVLARTELEVEVSDFEMMDLLLQKLGFHESWIYEKYRTTYALDDCEVVLDEMPYGSFVEVEGPAEAIEKVLTSLDLQDKPRILESYSTLFFQIKDRLGLSARDLTFDNFRGVHVPESLFTP